MLLFKNAVCVFNASFMSANVELTNDVKFK
jgi:hypothetical protein